MQFNPTSPTSGVSIIGDITFWTGASITDYSLADRTGNSNLALDTILGLILEADQKWEWDDSNNTDLPIGTTSLVANQKDYGISGATYLKITKVLCKDANGTWRTLKPMDKNSPEAKNLNEQTNPGTPTHYDLIGNSIFLGPYPNYASTGGLRIFFQRNVSYFITTDTTKAPGFAQPFHRLVSLYASDDYLSAKGLVGDRLKRIQNKIEKMENALLKFYASRNAEDRPRLRFRKENYGENELKQLDGGGDRYTPPNVI